ncbi:MAG: hypothetical protein GPJ52_00840 [Candidatus Heimdallarchaeota archaeon]|nr:hypothetical protein [Candidatus Heimdallarchaeota archaeon]
MEKRNLVGGLLYSDTGQLFHFAFNIDKAEEYDLGETLREFASASYDFLLCYKHGKKLHKAKLLKLDDEIKEHREQLLAANTNGLNKIRKANQSLKKAIKILIADKSKKFDIKEKFDEREVLIKKAMMKSNLNPNQIKIALKELEKARKIIEKEGEIKLLEQFARTFDEFEKGLSKPEEAWNGAICLKLILLLLLISIIGPFIIYAGVYVANLRTKEVHDGDVIAYACKIHEMAEENKAIVEDFDLVLVLFEKHGYNGCAWCMPEYDTG